LSLAVATVLAYRLFPTIIKTGSFFMLGNMQDWPLLVSKLIDHAAQEHGNREIVTNLVEGGIHRGNWRDVQHRSKQLAQVLERLGLKHGDRIATLAWNSQRHLECWFGISGAGLICHTLNPRLFVDQLEYIINHAEDAVIIFDTSFAPLIDKIAPRLKSVKYYIALTDTAHMPSMSSVKPLCFDALLATENGDYSWPTMDENTPCGLCYTSGTTGNPKGVLYSHRSNMLHTFVACMVDTMAISSAAVVLPVVPMFHANAWGIPYSAAATGAKLVFAGAAFDAPTLHKLIIDEGVNFTAAVPTIWLAMLQYLEASGLGLGKLKNVSIGGSAAPRMMIEKFLNNYNVNVSHAWGMTEMSPLGTVGTLSAEALELDPDAQIDLKCKQGRSIIGVEMKIVDDAGKTLPRDGKSFGRLMVRGPWIVDTYFKGDGGVVLDADGFFDTGDVSTIDQKGYMQITDRAKDVIKSGGEWISSIDIENFAVGHPAVAEAAVIGIAHPKWDERPLLVVVKKADIEVSKQELLDFIAPRIAKWWIPDDVQFVPELPHTATGKVSKLELRKIFSAYTFPTA
jgi:acyl-CoA synthetase (AMP-forming)/AMP-acid ligase II